MKKKKKKKNISKYRMIKNVVGILDNKLIFRLIKYDLKQILPFIFAWECG